MPYVYKPKTREERLAAHEKRKRRKLVSDPKALLIRDHNWRMGRLRAYYAITGIFDDDLKGKIDAAIHEQMRRDNNRLVSRTENLRREDEDSYDGVVWEAIRQSWLNAQHNVEAANLRLQDKIIKQGDQEKPS